MMLNYLDTLGLRIYRAVELSGAPGSKDVLLYRLYAVLAMAKGQDVTAKDVHNAWAAWAVEHNPEHASPLPFDDLSQKIQALDEPYVDAIRRVAAEEAAAASLGTMFPSVGSLANQSGVSTKTLTSQGRTNPRRTGP